MKYKLLVASTLTLAFNFCVYSQVGIGTTNPTSELEIETTDMGLPALELNPQTAPTGTADGQISVINGKLYMYDNTRSKWLSLTTIPFNFGRTGNVATQNLRREGNLASANSGTLMPFNGTIVAITANSNVNSAVAGNNLNKEFNVRIRAGNVTQGTAVNFNLASGTYTDTVINRDFNAGDHFTVRARDPDASGDTINNPMVTLWVKWRE